MSTVTDITPETKCIRCGVVLTSRRSIHNGYGDDCREIMNAAAEQVAGLFTRDQIRKAATALRTGTVHWVSEGLYTVESSNGRDVYFTTVDTCGCPASKRCYHECAVMIRELTPLHQH